MYRTGFPRPTHGPPPPRGRNGDVQRKELQQWAMYMEALHVHRGVWDVVSGMGEYNPVILEDAIYHEEEYIDMNVHQIGHY
ncbi:hypothetical protein V1506DRAFT_46746 [Lipomyces tetrasporus]